MCSKKEALKTIVTNEEGYGKISELITKIGKENFSQFKTLGYIHEVMSSEKLQAKAIYWEVTPLAQNEYKFYLKFGSVTLG